LTDVLLIFCSSDFVVKAVIIQMNSLTPINTKAACVLSGYWRSLRLVECSSSFERRCYTQPSYFLLAT